MKKFKNKKVRKSVLCKSADQFWIIEKEGAAIFLWHSIVGMYYLPP